MIRRLFLVAACALPFLAAVDIAFATPSRIIILRHGEKQNAWKLCAVGDARAAALAGNFLGKGAANSLFAVGETPAAFLAITLHTLELAAPAAATWGQPVILYSVVPESGMDKKATTVALNKRTQEAAGDVLTTPAYDGKTVVMVWEHDHIAQGKLAQEFKPEKVTLRQLLGLGTLKDVPRNWPGANYDYFWIVNFADGKPSKVELVKQDFPETVKDVPENDWGKPNGMAKSTHCKGAGKDAK